MIFSPAARMSSAYCDGTTSPAAFTASSAWIGGAMICTPAAFNAASCAFVWRGIGGFAVVSIESRYTACRPNAGSLWTQ